MVRHVQGSGVFPPLYTPRPKPKPKGKGGRKGC